MEEIIPCPIKDQEVFRRVWQRVMGERETENCPVEALPADLEGDLPCACLEELARQNQAEALSGQTNRQSEAAAEAGWAAREPQNQALMGREGTMTAGQMARESEQMAEDREAAGETAAPEPSAGEAEDAGPLPAENGPDRGNDLPRLWEAPQEQPDRTGRMRRQVMEALEGWQFYRHLARRARGADARVLNALAGEEHRAARKLAAAYFLLTGVRYWPSELLTTPALPSYWGALRGRHQAEQRREMDYRISADDWDDPDQLELYRELAEEAQGRSRQLRMLLEEDHMM